MKESKSKWKLSRACFHGDSQVMWEEEYLKKTLEPVRPFSIERDGIQDYSSESEESEDEISFARIPFCEESSRGAGIRERAYNKAWQTCESDIRDVLRNLYHGTIEDIKSFVRGASTSARFGQRQITTGLILGANQTLSSSLVEGLRHLSAPDNNKAGPSNASEELLVARIWSRDCPNKRVALKKIISSVIACSETPGSGDAPKRTTGKKLSMLASDDLGVLTAWYQAKYGSERQQPKIVLSFEELESFEPAVLSELLYTLSLHTTSLPLLLLFGVSTSVDAIHNLLPRASSELLRIATFIVTPSVETFHRLMMEIFMKRQQVITPSAKVFAFLRDTFLDLDQSIDGLIAKLKYMYLAHFFGNPASVWCTDFASLDDEHQADDANEDDLVMELLGETITSLRAIPSYQKAMEKSTDNAVQSGNAAARRAISHLLNSDAGMLGSIKGARSERQMHAKKVPEAWTLFEVLQSTWAEGRLSMESMLSEYFAGTLAKRACTACNNLKNARDDVVLSFLRNVQSEFGKAKDVAGNLDQHLEVLEDLVQNGQKQEGLTRFVNGNIQGSIARSSGDKRFTTFVSDLSAQLEKYFRNHLKPFSDLTFHELWYPDLQRLLRSAFHPHTVEQLHVSLADPASRLPQHLFNESTDLPSVDDFDICKAHALLAEAGKLVNLSDWYGAFEVALDGEDVPSEEASENVDHRKTKRRKANTSTSGGRRPPDRKGKGRATTNGDEEIGSHAELDGADSEDEETARSRRREARFLAAAADLAYIGFIQPTKRKAEHVSRVVF